MGSQRHVVSAALPQPLARWIRATSLILASGGFASLFAADSTTDIEQGGKLFQGMCVTCHGFAGAGGDAPSLNRPKLDRAPDDVALRAILTDGIPERGMPRVRRFTDNEIRLLTAYVRSLGQVKSAPVKANAKN